ncbi:glycosyltransferase family 4 protein [Flavobacteriaceae bacterium GSB9]|nr:glycosyltransferase family 4 protein [Flavobacteriaceae bacterium GSB9]
MNQKKQHIIIFDGSFETTPFIRRLMTGLINRGYKVSVIGFNEHNPEPVEGVYYQSLGSNQSKLRFIQTSLALALRYGNVEQVLKALFYFFKGQRKAIQTQNLSLVFKSLQPDIVHVQWPSLLPWLEPYLQNPDFKIVLSQRGFHVNVRPFVNAENMRYLQSVYPKLDGLHSVSKAISETGKAIGVPYTGIDEVVYTGFPLDQIDFQNKTKRHDTLRLLSVGRAHWIKDYPTAVKACAVLKAKGLDFHYTIIGGQGDEELLFLIHDLGLEQCISLIGKMSQSSVYEQMRNTDILLLPSIEEGLANVAVEAMALGTPVISTDCGGMPELITHGITGWLVPVGAPEAMANEILKVQSLPNDVLHTITKAARNIVEEQHSETQLLRGMEKLYKQVLEP